jgi:hypothetical protein
LLVFAGEQRDFHSLCIGNLELTALHIISCPSFS